MQGKTNKQLTDSYKFAGLACFGFFTLVFVMVMANILPDATPAHELQGPPHNYWVPTEDDILYQDSMYQIIEATQTNMDTINKGMERILLKLDVIIYENGLSESIKLYEQNHVDKFNSFMDVPAGCDSIIIVSGIAYKKHDDAWEAYMDKDGVEKGVMIDPIYNDEHQMWITGNGDTIYE